MYKNIVKIRANGENLMAWVSAVISSFSCSGNGWVYVQSSSGGLSVFLNTCKSVDSPDKVKKGTRVTGRAAITNPSILNSLYSSGYFTF